MQKMCGGKARGNEMYATGEKLRMSHSFNLIRT